MALDLHSQESPRSAYCVSVSLPELPISYIGKSCEILGISENCRLCRGGAELESEKLAAEYLAALLPRLIKKYGDSAAFCISKITYAPKKFPSARIQRSSEIVRWRLEVSDFNPKSKPPLK